MNVWGGGVRDGESEREGEEATKERREIGKLRLEGMKEGRNLFIRHRNKFSTYESAPMNQHTLYLPVAIVSHIYL